MTDVRVPAPTVLGVDVGGTAIKTWVQAGDGGGRVAADAVPTPKDDPTGERTADAVAAIVSRVSGIAGPIAAVGVATPGIVDDAAGVCRAAVNLGWREVPFAALLGERIPMPVVLTWDVRAGAIAEKRSGAGRGRPGPLLFAPIGTGLAVALVDEDGRPVGTAWAGEVGQVRLVHGANSGAKVEDIASAGGLARRFGVQQAMEVARAREAGDPLAARLWDEAVDVLAEVLAWCIAVVAPTTVVVGGGLAQAGDALLGPLREGLAVRLPGFPAVEVRQAHHGTAAVAVGAAGLALVHLGEATEGLR